MHSNYRSISSPKFLIRSAVSKIKTTEIKFGRTTNIKGTKSRLKLSRTRRTNANLIKDLKKDDSFFSFSDQESTSSSSTSESSDEDDKINEQILKYSIDSIEEIQSSEDEFVSLTELDDNRKEDIMETRDEILKTFRRLPHIDEVSLELTDVTKSSSSTSSTYISPLDKYENLKIEDISYSDDSDYNSSEYDRKYSELLTPSISVYTLEEVYEFLQEMIVLSETKIETYVAHKYESKDNDNEIDYIKQFLNKLIKRCVSDAENPHNKLVLNFNLDKRKLINELAALINLMNIEKEKSNFLNNKVTTHFKRQGVLRAIKPENPKNLLFNYNTFILALQNLDKSLAQEKNSAVLYANQIQNEKDKLEKLKQLYHKELHKLENLIKKTFQKRHFDKLYKIVELKLKKMYSERELLSENRLNLFLHLYTLSELQKKMGCLKELEHFGFLEMEINALNKKDEEYNQTLIKFHDHVRTNIHMMSHMKKKHQILNHHIIAQKLKYDELKQKERNLHQYVYEEKLKHTRSKDKIKRLIFGSGIALNPALMKDYDETVERANNLQKTNDNLRKTVEELTTKLSILEQNCEIEN